MLTSVLELCVRQLNEAVFVIMFIALANFNGLFEQGSRVLFQFIVVLSSGSRFDVFNVCESCLDGLVLLSDSTHGVCCQV